MEDIEVIELSLKNETADVNTFNKYIERSCDDDKIEIEKKVLYSAFEKDNIEIIKLLLIHEKINVNILNKFSEQISGQYKDLYNEKTYYTLQLKKKKLQ